MDLTTTAEELYSLLPGDFTATRNAKAKEANQSGDKDLGKQIRALPKPSVAAWLVNMLVRRRAEEIDGVLELGASLQQAQEDLDQKQLRELGGQRHKLLSALVEQARSLADDLNQNVSAAVAGNVEQTLHAAMADVDAANAVASGMLTRALASTGWEPVDLEGAVAVPDAVEQVPAMDTSEEEPRKPEEETDKDAGKSTAEPPEPKEEADEESSESREAKSDLEEAEQRLEEAEARQHSLEEQLEEADSRQEELAAETDKLKKRLAKLERERKEIDSEVDRLESDQDDAIHAAKDARRTARRARRRVNELS